MRAAGDAGISEGIAIAGELIDYARGRFAGFFIMPPFNKYQIALKLVEKIKAGLSTEPQRKQCKC